MARALALALLLSFGTIVSNAFARFAYALVLPAMRADLGWTWAQAGWLNTVNAAGYLAGAVLTRLLVVRLGNRRIFQAGMLVTALSILAAGLTRDLGLLSAARLLAGVSGAAVFICGGALAANVWPERPSFATTSIVVYIGAAGIGMVLSGAGIPLLLDARGDAVWPVVWQAMGAVSLAMALAAAWGATRIAEPGAAAGDGRWSAGPFAFQMLGYLMFAVGYIGYMTFVIALMRENGAGTGAVIATWSLLGLASLAAPFLWHGPFERWPGGRPMAAGLACLAVGALLALVLADGAWMPLSALLFGIGMFCVPASVTVLVKRGLPPRAWGSAMAVFTIVFGAGQVVGPVLTGWLADLSGSLRPGLGASVAVLALGAVLAMLQKEPASRA
jgi:MFS family permease